MRLLQLLGFCSIVVIATSVCRTPDPLTPGFDVPWATKPIINNTIGPRAMYFCAENGYVITGNYKNGESIVSAGFDTMCYQNDGIYRSDSNNKTSLLTKMICASVPYDDNLCAFTTDGVIYIVQDRRNVTCPTGEIFKVPTLGDVRSLNCLAGFMYATAAADGMTYKIQNDRQILPEAKCEPLATTSSTTVATTTTNKPGCERLPVTEQVKWQTREFNETNLPDGGVKISCDKRVVGNFGAINGNLTAELSSYYTCNPAVGKWIAETGVETGLKTMVCADTYAVFAERCYYYFNDLLRTAPHTQVLVCPMAKPMVDEVRGPLLSIECHSANMFGTFPNNTFFNQTDGNGGLFRVKCPSAQD